MCVPKVRNCGDFKQGVIPVIITCMLQGIWCDTEIPTLFIGKTFAVYIL